MASKADEMEILYVSSVQIMEDLQKIQEKFKEIRDGVKSKCSGEYKSSFGKTLKNLYHLASSYEQRFLKEGKQSPSKDQMKQQEDLIKHYNKKIEDLKKELQEERKAKDEALTRVSALASQLLKPGNPDIADISDRNRPTRLAEDFKNLYDDEWTDAFEYMTEECKWTENKATSLLYDLLQICNDLSKEGLYRQYTQIEGLVKSPELFRTKQQHESQTKNSTIVQVKGRPQTTQAWTQNFTKTVGATASQSFRQEVLGKDDGKDSLLHLEPHFMEVRKVIAEDTLKTVTTRGLLGMVKQKMLPKDDIIQAEPITKYITKSFRLCWYLGIQYPPMEIDFSHKSGDLMKPEQLKIYKTRGSKISHVVWPPLFLHHNGPLAGVGFAEGDGSTYL